MSKYPEIDAVLAGESGGCVVCADCLDVLRELPDKCVDAVVTDPPYGIGWTRGTWDDAPEEYAAKIGSLVSSSNRLSNGYVFVFQAMPNVGRFHEWFPDGWKLFAACKNFAQIRPTGVWHSWDPVVFWNTKPNTKPNSTTVNRDYHVGNVAGCFGGKLDHPCPRPLDTMEHIAALAAPSNGIILDPFAGSGTTLVAAKRLGRRYIGIEICERYCEISRNRLRNAERPLFTESPE